MISDGSKPEGKENIPFEVHGIFKDLIHDFQMLVVDSHLLVQNKYKKW